MPNDKQKSSKGKVKGKKRGTPIVDLPTKTLQPDASRNIKGGIRPMYGSPATRDM